MRRGKAALVFLVGEHWFAKESKLAVVPADPDDFATPPEWLNEHADTILQATLLGMLVLALLGCAWCYPWRRHGRIGVIAVLFIPLPYILSHAEVLSGPRLPLDGVLLCFAAYALVGLVPGMVKTNSSV